MSFAQSLKSEVTNETNRLRRHDLRGGLLLVLRVRLGVKPEEIDLGAPDGGAQDTLEAGVDQPLSLSTADVFDEHHRKVAGAAGG